MIIIYKNIAIYMYQGTSNTQKSQDAVDRYILIMVNKRIKINSALTAMRYLQNKMATLLFKSSSQ
jgi:hypothetical protein